MQTVQKLARITVRMATDDTGTSLPIVVAAKTQLTSGLPAILNDRDVTGQLLCVVLEVSTYMFGQTTCISFGQASRLVHKVRAHVSICLPGSHSLQ